MLIEVSGDILLSKAHAVAHGVAPNDDFHTGLGLALRERWPAMYKDFRHYCHMSHPKAGEIWVWHGAEDTHIYNLFTQVEAYAHGSKPGRATIENVNHCLHHLAKDLMKHEIKSLAVTKLGAGVQGGLIWEDVKQVMTNVLSHVEIPIFVYTMYHPNVAAKEEAH